MYRVKLIRSSQLQVVHASTVVLSSNSVHRHYQLQLSLLRIRAKGKLAQQLKAMPGADIQTSLPERSHVCSLQCSTHGAVLHAGAKRPETKLVSGKCLQCQAAFAGLDINIMLTGHTCILIALRLLRVCA